jgi:hypothetical protein
MIRSSTKRQQKKIGSIKVNMCLSEQQLLFCLGSVMTGFTRFTELNTFTVEQWLVKGNHVTVGTQR